MPLESPHLYLYLSMSYASICLPKQHFGQCSIGWVGASPELPHNRLRHTGFRIAPLLSAIVHSLCRKPPWKLFPIPRKNESLWSDFDLSILSLCFCSNRRLSFSMCLMRFSMNNRRSRAPNLVTSVALFSLFSPSPSIASIGWSNNDVLSLSKVSSRSIAAHFSSYSSSSSPSLLALLKLLLKLAAAARNDDSMLLLASSSSTVKDSGSFLLPMWAILFRTAFGFSANQTVRWLAHIKHSHSQSFFLTKGTASATMR